MLRPEQLVHGAYYSGHVHSDSAVARWHAAKRRFVLLHSDRRARDQGDPHVADARTEDMFFLCRKPPATSNASANTPSRPPREGGVSTRGTRRKSLVFAPQAQIFRGRRAQVRCRDRLPKAGVCIVADILLSAVGMACTGRRISGLMF